MAACDLWNCLSAMILNFPKPDSRDMLHTTHKRHSTQISGWLLYVCMPPVDSRRPSGTIDATEDQLGAWPTFMGCLWCSTGGGLWCRAGLGYRAADQPWCAVWSKRELVKLGEGFWLALGMFVPVNFEVMNRAIKGWFLLIFVSIFGSSESGEISVSVEKLKMVLVIMDLRWNT